MSDQPSIAAVRRERRHTLYFLHEIRSMAPVFLDTEVDMSRVNEHQAAARRAGTRYSRVAYVLHATGRVLAAHPRANVAIRGRRWPRMAHYPAVHGKLTLDKTLHGQRVVLAAVLPDLDRSDLDAIQRQIDTLRDGDPATLPQFSGARALHRLPRWLGSPAFRLAVRPLRRRAATLGTVAVTSLGHRPVDSFHSSGGTTITLGVGRTVDRPAVRDGQLSVAPLMRLSLAFDHRAVDGAEAADVLGDLKTMLEEFSPEGPANEPVARQLPAPAG